ncbi:MAG: Spy/CpxP family protein refolding chaperone [Gammaproteobacteria bacterium]|nr:Spy/CpxP family protein refolding chaperone [Gammaproteobacteria bacterium]MDH5653785.1 Spy/CpxP family protein refolding chaperone [Gammaproteobacteria bacterium]
MCSRLCKAVFLVGGLALAFGLGACAGKHHRSDPEKHAEWLVEKITDKLELNEAQQGKLKDFTQQVLIVRKSLKNEKPGLHDDFLTMLSQPKLDRNQALQRINQHIDALQSRAPVLVNSFADFYDTLNEQQRRILQDKLREHKEHRQHHHW